MISFASFSDELCKIAKARWAKEMADPEVYKRYLSTIKSDTGFNPSRKKWNFGSFVEGQKSGTVAEAAKASKGGIEEKRKALQYARTQGRPSLYTAGEEVKGATKEQRRKIMGMPLGTKARKPLWSAELGESIPFKDLDNPEAF